MSPIDHPAPARRNIPMIVVALVAVLAALGFAFVWPW
jgi:hypothetical protein